VHQVSFSVFLDSELDFFMSFSIVFTFVLNLFFVWKWTLMLWIIVLFWLWL
jgi:hypothetical protein